MKDAELWPSADVRFAQFNRYRRVNTAERFVVSKTKLVVGVAALIGLTMAATANADASLRPQPDRTIVRLS